MVQLEVVVHKTCFPPIQRKCVKLKSSALNLKFSIILFHPVCFVLVRPVAYLPACWYRISPPRAPNCGIQSSPVVWLLVIFRLRLRLGALELEPEPAAQFGPDPFLGMEFDSQN